MPAHWTDRLFARLAAIYGHKMQSIYPDEKSLLLAKSEWSIALGGTPPDRIAAALSALISDCHAWPPSLPEFANMCRPSSNVPDAAEAWRIICNARGNPGTLRERYQHPIVLTAVTTRGCDAYNWSKMPEKDGLRRFAPLYERLLERLDNGEQYLWLDEVEKIERRKPSEATEEEKVVAKAKIAEELKKARIALRRAG